MSLQFYVQVHISNYDYLLHHIRMRTESCLKYREFFGGGEESISRIHVSRVAELRSFSFWLYMFVNWCDYIRLLLANFFNIPKLKAMACSC
jgi:hypothetical protein